MDEARRAARHRAAKDEIVAAAWELVREHGLAGLGMRDLAARLGMKAPSLYSYVASKYEVYDAMFLEGYLAYEEAMAPYVVNERADLAGRDPLDVLRGGARRFFSFCVDDPARFSLLFQRTIPGFEPSAESYAVAVRALERVGRTLAVLGADDPGAVDLWSATLTGLVSQQLANEPGGDRWERLVDRAVAMLVAETAPRLARQPAPARRPDNRRTA